MDLEDYFYDSVVRGHHIYKSTWTPFAGEVLSVNEEDGNEHDPYAVCVLKNEMTVGHVPREVSRIFYFFLRHGGTISCEITGHRKFGHGLEVPCCYKLSSKPKHIKKALQLLELKKKKHKERTVPY